MGMPIFTYVSSYRCEFSHFANPYQCPLAYRLQLNSLCALEPWKKLCVEGSIESSATLQVEKSWK